MSKKSAVQEQHIHDVETCGMGSDEALDAMVRWIRTLKAEGVTPDTAANLFVQVLQTTIEANTFGPFSEFEEFDYDEEDDEEE